MDRLSTGLRPVGFLILVGAGLLATWWIAAGCVWAGDGQAGGSDSARAQRIEELQKQRDRIQRELNQLKQQPEGVSRSVIPRSEMSDQPVRTLKESMESVPGVAVSPGAGDEPRSISPSGDPANEPDEPRGCDDELSCEKPPGALFLLCLGLAVQFDAQPSLNFPYELGQKFVTEHKVKSVVGPSVQVDEQGYIALAWMEEDKDVRSVLFARSTQPGGPMGIAGSSESSGGSPLLETGSARPGGARGTRYL